MYSQAFSVYQKNFFSYFSTETDVIRILNETVLWAPKTYVKTDGWEDIYNLHSKILLSKPVI